MNEPSPLTTRFATSPATGIFTHLAPEIENSAGGDQVIHPAAPPPRLPFDPLRVVDTLARRWWLIAGSGMACSALLGMLGMMHFDTRYTAQAQLIKQETANAFRQSETGETFKPREVNLSTLSSMLQSSTVISAAAESMGRPADERALRNGLEITPVRNTDLLNVSMSTNSSPDEALAMLKAYTDAALKLAEDLQRGDAGRMKDFLHQQIVRAEADLVKVNEELLAYGREAQLIDAEKQMDAWLAEVGNFTLKYETLKLDYETIDVRIQGVERELAKVDTRAARIDEARQELARLSVRYTDEHPAVIEAREKLEYLEAGRATAQAETPPKPGESNVAESLYLELVRLRMEKTMLADQLEKLAKVRESVNERLTQLPRKAMEYARIRSRQQTLETSRALLAGRHREAVLHEENAQGCLRLFSMARPQDVAEERPTQKVMMAAIGGFGIGAVLVAAGLVSMTMMDGRIRSAGDLRRVTGLPVIGQMPSVMKESEEAWAFRTWTRLQPMLQVQTGDGALVCGIMHAGGDDSATRMTNLLAQAASRRGLGCIAITRQLEGTTLRLADAVHFPANFLVRMVGENPEKPCLLGIDEEWTWTAEQRRQWQAAMACWRSLSNVVVLIDLPPVEMPETLILAEQLPNLVWAATSGGTNAQKVGETLAMYRDAGCRLVGAVLDRAPVLRPAMLARFIIALTLGMAPLQAELVLGPGDSVNVTMPGFIGHERYDLAIGPDGCLTYLQARDIVAAGLSIDQLREKLSDELGRYYRNARVVVTPAAFQSRKVYVMGKVVNKGAINLERPMTILEVVAEAGGLETGLFQQNTVELADLKRSFVMRGQQCLPVNMEALFMRGDMSQNAAVEPGDYLYFPSANSNEIYVLGDVNMQGVQGLLAHTSVHSAIAQAGGFTEKAFTRRVLVVRGSLEQPERLVVDLNDVLNARAKGFNLEPGDIVYVADKPWARAEELLDMAINAFLQGAVSGWTFANIGPFIKQPVLPQLR